VLGRRPVAMRSDRHGGAGWAALSVPSRSPLTPSTEPVNKPAYCRNNPDITAGQRLAATLPHRAGQIRFPPPPLSWSAFAQVRRHQGRHTARHGWRPSCVWPSALGLTPGW